MLSQGRPKHNIPEGLVGFELEDIQKLYGSHDNTTISMKISLDSDCRHVKDVETTRLKGTDREKLIAGGIDSSGNMKLDSGLAIF
eukprot:scaffold131286_cov88-Cyclotella_meneghiniana.AAC.1